MPKLVILGNGFDLQCGLKSSYCNFYDYLKEKMNAKTGQKPINEDNIIWLLLQSYHSEKDKYLWKDIEQILYYFLVKTDNDYMINYKKMVEEYVNYRRLMGNKLDLTEEEKIKLDKEREKKIKENGVKQRVLFAKKLYDCEKAYNYKFVVDPIRVNELKSLEEQIELIEKDLNSIEKIFKIYLLEKLKEPNKEKIDYKADKLYVELLGYTRDCLYLDEKTKEKIKNNYFISFNYTKLGFMKEINNPLFINIHGSLENDYGLIFGIDGRKISPKSLENPIYRFSKIHRVSLFMEHKQNPFSNFDLQNVDEIIIYGHSLNNQDYSYFFTIFDNTNIINSKVKITLFYSNYYDTNGEYINGFKERESSLKKIIYDYGESLNIYDLYQKMYIDGRIGIKEIKD